jgi:hypothetical protein
MGSSRAYLDLPALLLLGLLDTNKAPHSTWTGRRATDWAWASGGGGRALMKRGWWQHLVKQRERSRQKGGADRRRSTDRREEQTEWRNTELNNSLSNSTYM